jgi:sucrose-6-phosphate hydrolase SacC (GH32 family)
MHRSLALGLASFLAASPARSGVDPTRPGGGGVRREGSPIVQADQQPTAPPVGPARVFREDILIADFEGATYGDWTTTGEAFGPGPAQGAFAGQWPVIGYQGHGLVNSFRGGDGPTGTLTSPPFKIEREFITFLIGGGGWPDRTCMNLLVDGKRVRTATGPHTQPGGDGTERLEPACWDVSELVGQTAIIQIVDQASGGWGHILVDQIVQTDQKIPTVLFGPGRDFRIEKRYLNLPIKNGAPVRWVTTLVDGKEEVVNAIELADGVPDWWAFKDVSAWRGRTVTLRVDRLPDNSTALRAIEPSDVIKDGENLYHEPLRPQFHFSSRRGWLNDPNGLCYYNGEYHLFYQHNPYGWTHGPHIHWGHAVSTDLVHWTELVDGLPPDAWSGSAVVDWNNTSRFGAPGKPPLVLIYTEGGRTQCLASSTDGRTFTKFSGNPVVGTITGGNRDPKVYWHEPTQKWVMALYVGLAEKNADGHGHAGTVNTIHFLTSPNLKDWTVTSHVDGFFECPDYFELPVDGDAVNRRWVLSAASSDYMLGAFDGATFTPGTPLLRGHWGAAFYAPQTFCDVPRRDGRRIQIGWFRTDTPGMPFNQSMTIPMELKLISTPEGPRLTRTPVRELEVLRGMAHPVAPMMLRPDSANPLAAMKAELIEVRAEFEPGDAEQVILTVRGATIVYDTKKQELAVNGHHAPAPLRGGRQRLAVFCDRVGLEVFASDGLTYMPMAFIPKPDNLSVGIHATGGAARLIALQGYELRSAWDAP